MALNGNALGDAMKAAVDALPDPKTDRTAIFRALGNAIVAHFVANATVTTSTPGAQAGGAVLAGTGTVA